MNLEQPTTKVNAATYNRWQRFVNWLAGGPPDPIKIEAAQKKYPTWYRRYALTLCMMIGTYIIVIHPFVISRLNDTPDLDRLHTLQVHIVQTREGAPHFDMRLPDGTVQTMEWPVEVTFSRGNRVYHWNKAQRQALVGCHATAQVAAMRWTFTDRYRVWSLSCPATNFDVGIDETFRELTELARSLTFLLVGFLIIFFLGLLFSFYVKSEVFYEYKSCDGYHQFLWHACQCRQHGCGF